MNNVNQITQTICVVSKPVDIAALRVGLRECVSYRIHNLSSGEVYYYYGGGSYSDAGGELILRKDYLRPMLCLKAAIQDVIYMSYDGNNLDILLSGGMWISSVSTPQLSSSKCDFLKAKFDDRRIVSVSNGVAVVCLPLLKVAFKDLVSAFKAIPLPQDLLQYPEPLTYAYSKNNGVLHIGFWDMINECYVGKLQRYGRRLLDINL